jgi:hypothetical protein
MKSSFHSLIPFLPLVYNCQLSSVPLLPGSYPGRLASRNSTQFSSSAPMLISRQAGLAKLDSILLSWTLLYNHFARTTQKIQSVHCWEGVITLRRRDCSIVSVFVAAGICLPSRCLAMNVYYNFTITDFGRHLTVSWRCMKRAAQVLRSQI